MSRDIRSIKTLKKKIGQTVRVTSLRGDTFDAIVCNSACTKDGVTLYTNDKRADYDVCWWKASTRENTLLGIVKGKYGHHINCTSHIRDELQSITTVKSTKTKKEPSVSQMYAGVDEVAKHIGDMCRLSDGTVGKIVIGHSKSPVLLLKEEAHGGIVGWPLSDEDREKYPEYSYGWYLHDQGCSVGKIVEFFKDTSETPVKEVKTSKTILDMTIRELLEKLNEIIVC